MTQRIHDSSGIDTRYELNGASPPILNLSLIFDTGAHGRTNDGEVYKVSRVIKHPQFSMQHLRHDVAVLRLARPANLNSKVGTVCLPRHGSRVKPGTTCYVTGKLYSVRLTHF